MDEGRTQTNGPKDKEIGDHQLMTKLYILEMT